MSDSRTKRERFLPFAYHRHGLRTKLQRLELDDRLMQDGIDVDSHLLDLRGPWSHARVTFEVTTAPGLIEHVLDEGERQDPPLTVLIAVRCPPTRLRRNTQRALATNGPTRIEIDIDRDDLHGTAELIPFLVRTKDARSPASGHAHTRGSRVAGGRSWALRADLERTPSGKYVDLRFKSFRDDPLIPSAEKVAVWRLDATSEEPILWLNQDHASIAKLLTYEGSHGRRARAREVLFDRISASVWTRLFLIAADNVLRAGEELYGWEQSVLDQMLPDLYPDVASANIRLERLRQEHDELHVLLGRLDAVLQVRDGGITNLVRLSEDT